jgi:hypothetical protein
LLGEKHPPGYPAKRALDIIEGSGNTATPSAMNPEIYYMNYKGAHLRIHLTHADVLAQLAKANLVPPEIPPGYNTVEVFVQLSTGEYAIVVGQRGFARDVSDDESEVNGLGMHVLQDRSWGAADARAILESIVNDLVP